MKTLLKILTLGLICLICEPIFAQKNAQLKLDFEKIICSKHSFPFNGVVIVSKNGKTIYEKVHGFKNFEEKIALNKSNQFEIMSNSKLFTSVLILKEVEKGNINLQKSIKTYLPEITQSWADSVTVHQLLNHTHGIQDINKPLLFKPGTEFKYGNYSNVLLGKILTNVTNKTFRELATNLFKEIGLNETFVYSKTEKHQLVQGYFYRNDSLFPNYQTMITEEDLPADGIISTANDLVKWNNLLHNGKILQPETYQLLITPSTLSQHDVFGKIPQGYAYNIRNITENNINYIGHTGLGDGFSAINIYFPKSKVSLVVLQNIMPNTSEDYYFYEKQFKNSLLESNLVR
ncbi:serine hydrolase domain-containing protein [Empedobacter falsenii]|uniref:Beta-lactamase family protein n=1 Tax=Empedobacter falsenii TaxID=343874 RepID=A0AAW7DI74_9FLAO|nr:serine hydrolase domain-containing protein [Empedobacter falsenii]MDM1551681.1 beta-lactamase family protein [Empedobacter falsenii]